MTARVQTPADGLAWVTGAGSGIGRATTLELVRAGWTVLATARSVHVLEAMARDHPGRIIAAPCDVTDAEAVAALLERVESAHGPVALAFLNAGISIFMSAPHLDLEAVRRMHAVNVMGVYNALAPLLPRMAARGKGQIAICASIGGYAGLPRGSAYGATKAAMISLAESLRVECAPLGIHVQVVNPGFVRTALTAKNDFHMPFLLEPDEAGRRCVAGFGSRRFEIRFPRRSALAFRFLSMLPYPLYFRIVRRMAPRPTLR